MELDIKRVSKSPVHTAEHILYGDFIRCRHKALYRGWSRSHVRLCQSLMVELLTVSFSMCFCNYF